MGQYPSYGRPGWHDDPVGRFDSRYWDGNGWTRAVIRGGQVESDPDDAPKDTSSAANVSSAAYEPAPEHRTGSAGYAATTAVPSPAAPFAAADRFTSLAPPAAQARLAQLLPIGGFKVVDSSPSFLAATVDVAGEPNWIFVVALCLLWLLPGFVYWYVKSRPTPRRLALQMLPVELGTRISIQGEKAALERAAPILAQLPW
jgi:Protein of unknown function (DUF2510)